MTNLRTYISIDVEADGPIPGVNSMLNFGAVVFGHDGQELGTFSANLLPLDGAVADEETMKWWATQPDAYRTVTDNQRRPEDVMPVFAELLYQYPNRVFVGYPATYDFMFIYWYLMKFYGKSPLSFS